MGLRLGNVLSFGKVTLGVAHRIVGADKKYGPLVEFNLNINNNRYENDDLKNNKNDIEEISE